MFQAAIGVRRSYPGRSHVSKDLQLGRATDNGVGKRSHAGLSLLDDIDSSTGVFCAILFGNLVSH